MFCYMCGSPLPDDCKFCVNCGAKQNVEAPKAPAPVAEPAAPVEPVSATEPIAPVEPAPEAETVVSVPEEEPVAPATEPEWVEPAPPVDEAYSEPAPSGEDFGAGSTAVAVAAAEPEAPVCAPPVEEAPVCVCCPTAPVEPLSTNRGLLKFILLSIITLGIYGMVIMSKLSTDINIIAYRHDGKRTMNNFVAFYVFGLITLGIVPLVWSTRLCRRIKGELARRGIAYKFGAGTYWIWGILCTLIIVGPFIYTHKLLKAMNLLSRHYNENG